MGRDGSLPEEGGWAVEHLLTTGHSSALCEQARRDLGPEPAGGRALGVGTTWNARCNCPSQGWRRPRKVKLPCPHLCYVSDSE